MCVHLAQIQQNLINYFLDRFRSMPAESVEPVLKGIPLEFSLPQICRTNDRSIVHCRVIESFVCNCHQSLSLSVSSFMIHDLEFVVVLTFAFVDDSDKFTPHFRHKWDAVLCSSLLSVSFVAICCQLHSLLSLPLDIVWHLLSWVTSHLRVVICCLIAIVLSCDCHIIIMVSLIWWFMYLLLVVADSELCWQGSEDWQAKLTDHLYSSLAFHAGSWCAIFSSDQIKSPMPPYAAYGPFCLPSILLLYYLILYWILTLTLYYKFIVVALSLAIGLEQDTDPWQLTFDMAAGRWGHPEPHWASHKSTGWLAKAVSMRCCLHGSRAIQWDQEGRPGCGRIIISVCPGHDDHQIQCHCQDVQGIRWQGISQFEGLNISSCQSRVIGNGITNK